MMDFRKRSDAEDQELVSQKAVPESVVAQQTGLQERPAVGIPSLVTMNPPFELQVAYTRYQ